MYSARLYLFVVAFSIPYAVAASALRGDDAASGALDMARAGDNRAPASAVVIPISSAGRADDAVVAGALAAGNPWVGIRVQLPIAGYDTTLGIVSVQLAVAGYDTAVGIMRVPAGVGYAMTGIR